MARWLPWSACRCKPEKGAEAFCSRSPPRPAAAGCAPHRGHRLRLRRPVTAPPAGPAQHQVVGWTGSAGRVVPDHAGASGRAANDSDSAGLAEACWAPDADTLVVYSNVGAASRGVVIDGGCTRAAAASPRDRPPSAGLAAGGRTRPSRPWPAAGPWRGRSSPDQPASRVGRSRDGPSAALRRPAGTLDHGRPCGGGGRWQSIARERLPRPAKPLVGPWPRC